MRKVKVLLESKKAMKDKKGRSWMGMNKEAAKSNKFRKINTIEVKKSLPKRIRTNTERHEYIEMHQMKHGKKYKVAHRIALKREKKPLKDVKFTEVKIKKK